MLLFQMLFISGYFCQEDRVQFISSILQKRRASSNLSYADVNIADIASKTEGYVFHDMESLIDRAIHFAVMSRMQHTSSNYKLLYFSFLGIDKDE